MAEQTSDKLIVEGQRQLERIRRFNKAVALEKLKEMDPYVFEYLTAALFEHFGYQATAATAGSDEGVDVYLRNGSQLSVVQCKRYDNNIGQPIIRDLYGTMFHNRAEEAYLVTTAQFTRQAEEWAENKPIHLVDGFTLVDWIMSTEAGASTPSISHTDTTTGLAAPVTPEPFEPYQPHYSEAEPVVMAGSATKIEKDRASVWKGRGLWFWAFCSLLVILLGFGAGLLYMRQSQISDSNNGLVTETEVNGTDEDDGEVAVLFEGDVEADASGIVSETVVLDGTSSGEAGTQATLAETSTSSADEGSSALAGSANEDTPTVQATDTPVPVSTATSTEEPTQTSTFVPTDTATVEPTATDAPAETATLEATDTPENTPTIVATATPLPTVTPVPAVTATKEAVRPALNLAGIYTRPPAQGMMMASSALQPVLDGDLSEWAGDGTPIRAAVAGNDKHDGIADLSAVFWSAWSPEGLYLAVRVDDDVYRSGPDGTDMWMGDGLEIHFDGALADDFGDSGVNEDDYQIGISFGPDLDEIRAYLWYPYDREGTIGVLGNVKKVEEGYQVEIELPTSLFQSAFSQDLLTSNNTFGFNLSINDNDSEDVAQETILSWSPARSTYNDPTEWGTLLLR